MKLVFDHIAQADDLNVLELDQGGVVDAVGHPSRADESDSELV